ncbi:hypothetical protein A2U01_0087269, partial [Trifolium medium]|nr:hypothetical protein [Trifolium medium]
GVTVEGGGSGFWSVSSLFFAGSD